MAASTEATPWHAIINNNNNNYKRKTVRVLKWYFLGKEKVLLAQCRAGEMQAWRELVETDDKHRSIIEDSKQPKGIRLIKPERENADRRTRLYTNQMKKLRRRQTCNCYKDKRKNKEDNKSIRVYARVYGKQSQIAKNIFFINKKNINGYKMQPCSGPSLPADTR